MGFGTGWGEMDLRRRSRVKARSDLANDLLLRNAERIKQVTTASGSSYKKSFEKAFREWKGGLPEKHGNHLKEKVSDFFLRNR